MSDSMFWTIVVCVALMSTSGLWRPLAEGMLENLQAALKHKPKFEQLEDRPDFSKSPHFKGWHD